MNETLLVMPTTNERGDTEIVWVPKDLAETIKKLGALEGTKAEIRKGFASIRETFDIAVEDCENQVERLRSEIDKRNKLLDEAVQYEYETWEAIDRKFGAFRSQISEKMQKTKEYANEISKSLDGINVWKIEKLLETIEKFNNMRDEDKELLRKLLQFENLPQAPEATESA